MGRRLSMISGPGEPVISTMMDEIICESEYIYKQPIQKELLPMVIYRDMIQERWTWNGIPPPRFVVSWYVLTSNSKLPTGRSASDRLGE